MEAFKVFFNDKGFDYFNYKSLDTRLQGLYLVPQEVGYEMLKSFCHKTARDEFLERSVIEFIDFAQFQAYAATSKNYHFIGISAALPALLQALFHNLLSFTNPFKSDNSLIEDDIETEYLFPDRLMKGRFNKALLYSEITSLVFDTIPNEKWQRKMAIKLAELAIVFCIGHEIGHVVRGHPVITQKRGLEDVTELNNPIEGKAEREVGKWLSQSWEIQADEIAMALLYSYAIGTAKNRKKMMHYLKCDDKLELYGKILFAVYFVFLLLGQQQYTVHSEGTHPAPICRITFLMAFFATAATDIDGYPEVAACEAMKKYAGYAEDAWNRIGFSSGRFGDNIDDLPAAMKDLHRANNMVKRIFQKYQWAFKN